MSSLAITRLYRQQIEQPRCEQPEELLASMLAMQGQDYAGAKWSLGARLTASTDAAIERALAEHRIVRTWALRGTLHFVHPAAVRWLNSLLAERLIHGNQRRYRELELDADTLRRSSALLGQAVTGGRTLTRKELFAMLDEDGISTAGQRGVFMLQHATLSGLICQGPAIRNQPTFYAVEALPAGPELPREAALAELARRYFTSRGPATLADFVTWSGLPVADARRGLEAVQSELEQVTVEGETYWLSGKLQTKLERSPVVHLLPAFEEYLLSYKDRRAMLDDEHAQKVYLANGFAQIVVLDGQIIGVWKRTLKKERVEIVLDLSDPLNATQRAALEAAAERYGKFVGLSPVLQDEYNQGLS
jgi:hypothetical protein